MHGTDNKVSDGEQVFADEEQLPSTKEGAAAAAAAAAAGSEDDPDDGGAFVELASVLQVGASPGEGGGGGGAAAAAASAASGTGEDNGSDDTTSKAPAAAGGGNVIDAAAELPVPEETTYDYNPSRSGVFGRDGTPRKGEVESAFQEANLTLPPEGDDDGGSLSDEDEDGALNSNTAPVTVQDFDRPRSPRSPRSPAAGGGGGGGDGGIDGTEPVDDAAGDGGADEEAFIQLDHDSASASAAAAAAAAAAAMDGKTDDGIDALSIPVPSGLSGPAEPGDGAQRDDGIDGDLGGGGSEGRRGGGGDGGNGSCSRPAATGEPHGDEQDRDVDAERQCVLRQCVCSRYVRSVFVRYHAT